MTAVAATKQADGGGLEDAPRKGPVAAPSYRARILIIDDEPAILRTLTRLLVVAGYEVSVARDGGQAIAQMKAQATFDAIVSDLDMPDIDGMSFLRAIRARDLDVPVVFLTGNPTVDTAVQALEHGAFRYLMKPAPTAQLLDVVARAVRWRRMTVVRQEMARHTPTVAAAQESNLETRFASALEKLWAAMQPIVSWGSRDVFAYEALVRTDEPTLRSPIDLFAAAEHLDRVRDLSRIIRRRVAESVQHAPQSALVFVNLHPTDLEDPELVSPDAPLSPYADRIVLEITESVGIDRIRGFGAHITRLRNLGYRIALDDLGAGYAGLSSFASLEPDVVKADMALVRGIDASNVKQKLFRSIATVCNDLGAVLVAEGVETCAERDCAASLGGNLFQGYLFARPDRGFPSPRM